jgi:exopolysaccharide biosynthesis polyprenyl glycosylphosphotransferase
VEERVQELTPTAQPVGTQTQPPRVSGPSARAQYAAFYRKVAVTDVLSIAVALLVAYWIRFGIEVPTRDFLLLVLAMPVVMVAVFASFHLYEAFRYTPAEEFRRIIFAVSLGLVGLMVFSFWSKLELAREWVGWSLALSLFLTLTTRRVWHWWMGRQRQHGRLSFATLIVGTNAEGLNLLLQMRNRSIGFTPVGLVAVGDDGADVQAAVPVVGKVEDLRKLIRNTGAECVFVASSAVANQDMNPIAKAVRLSGVEVRITANLQNVLASRLSVQPLGGITALSLRPVRLTGTQVVAKFTFDILLSSLMLIVLSPLLIVTALAVKLTSPGPILFRQQRVGLRGRPFTMLKFRTMVVGADRMVDDLRAAHGVEDVMFKLRRDPRVTTVGRFLRKFSIDELPQLLNVVKGDMSLVGPRPPLPEEVTRYEDWQFDRLEVPPGITGLWQVSGRADLSFDDAVRLDLFYIENWSLTYDLFIIAKTVPVLLTSRGAY